MSGNYKQNLIGAIDVLDFSLEELLNSYREAARTERDKGTYFEQLAIAFLMNDPVSVHRKRPQ
ncbi:hypothetical protein [Ruegeria atlantica]|uniref:hypothetical protein n=1 Tax=Ruegeria atlantica TaxID=81569 RepID=UPI00249464B3|nr:hypothetical protein [Ruegeria atlantica]